MWRVEGGCGVLGKVFEQRRVVDVGLDERVHNVRHRLSFRVYSSCVIFHFYHVSFFIYSLLHHHTLSIMCHF